MAVPDRDHPGTPYLHAPQPALPTGKGKFFPVEYQPPIEQPDSEYPFVLSTGRTLYHYNSATMTMREAGVTDKQEEPFFEIHAEDASALGIADGERRAARLAARRARGARRTTPSASTRASSGWRSTSPQAKVNWLTHDVGDPLIGTPEYKVSAVRWSASDALAPRARRAAAAWPLGRPYLYVERPASRRRRCSTPSMPGGRGRRRRRPDRRPRAARPDVGGAAGNGDPLSRCCCSRRPTGALPSSRSSPGVAVADAVERVDRPRRPDQVAERRDAPPPEGRRGASPRRATARSSLGIGVNVNQTRDELPERRGLAADADRPGVAASDAARRRCSTTSATATTQWRDGGLDAVYDGLGPRDFLRGRRVSVERHRAAPRSMIDREGRLRDRGRPRRDRHRRERGGDV